MLRNTELRIAIWASLALMLVTACLLQPISTAAMLITFITQDASDNISAAQLVPLCTAEKAVDVFTAGISGRWSI